MTAAWLSVPLGEVLIAAARPERVDPLKEYRLLGVRLDGEGPFLRETKPGSQMSATTLYKVEAGDFIYSRLFAWRGAFGLMPPDMDGCYVSGEFPTFRAVPDRLDLKLLRYWFRLRSTLDVVLADCTGSTPLTRNRFKEEFFLRLRIPVPPLSEQRRIVARIDDLAARHSEALALCRKSAEAAAMLVARARDARFAALGTRFGLRRLGDLIFMASGEGLTSSQMDKSAQYPVYGGGGMTGWYSRYLFEEPTIAIGRVGARCGCVFLTEPKAWITDNALYLTSVSPQLHRPYLVQAMIALDIRQRANQAAQPVVSQKKINPLQIPVPPLGTQRAVSAELDALQAKVDELKRLQTETRAELDALMPSVLDRAFKGEL